MGLSAALLKREIELKLAHRVPAALSPLVRPAARLQATGNAALDTLLGGGFPLGSLCEVTGPECSGRSAIALSLLAEMSREGACAYSGTDVTVGRHRMAHCRAELKRMNVFPAKYLRQTRHGTTVRIAGCVIARQRPGTAHGFIFLSIEDETGIANAIIDLDLYEANRNLVTYGKVLLVEGMLQNVDQVVHVRMLRIAELTLDAPLALKSHDFH